VLIDNLDRNAVQRRGRESSRRRYAIRKRLDICVRAGCQSKPESGHTRCSRHLDVMLRDNQNRTARRKAEGLCVYCGVRPQFWGMRCIICRQLFGRCPKPLPRGLLHALRLHRQAEQRSERKHLQSRARHAMRALIATGIVTGDYARALSLYAGLDDGVWRSYGQVGTVMHISRERVRQLLYPSKVILTDMLSGDVPWRPLTRKNCLTI